jgi:hypothetical protein
MVTVHVAVQRRHQGCDHSKLPVPGSRVADPSEVEMIAHPSGQFGLGPAVKGWPAICGRGQIPTRLLSEERRKRSAQRGSSRPPSVVVKQAVTHCSSARILIWADPDIDQLELAVARQARPGDVRQGTWRRPAGVHASICWHASLPLRSHCHRHRCRDRGSEGFCRVEHGPILHRLAARTHAIHRCPTGREP